MSIVNPLSLLIGLLVSAPSIWAAFEGPADLTPVLLRFVLATILAGLGVSGLGMLVRHYARGAGRPAAAVEQGSITVDEGM